MLVLVPPRVQQGFVSSCFPEQTEGVPVRWSGGCKQQLCPGWTERRTVESGLKVDRLTGGPRVKMIGMSPNLSSPKPGHTTGGSGRGARRGGGAGSGRTGCQQNCSPRRQASLAPSKASKTRRLNVSPEARTSEILCKPMEEQTSG